MIRKEKHEQNKSINRFIV